VTWARKMASAIVPRARVAVASGREHGLGRGGARFAAHHLLGRLHEAQSDEAHLTAALEWLRRAQDACGGRGVSAAYHLGRGWGVPYPETSGYILSTFLVSAHHLGNAGDADRALAIGDWELEIQAPSGGVLSSPERPETRVFNTGQVILGWCDLFESLGHARHLEGARRAGEYLLAIQAPDGAWHKDTYSGARTYHARTAWSLVKLAKLTGERRFAEAGARNIEWVLAQRNPVGWYAACGFHSDDPITHILAYTLRGLLECHRLGDPALAHLDLLGAVRPAADAIARVAFEPGVGNVRGMLPASFAADWSSRDRYSCVTGNAQLAILLYKLARLTVETRYAHAADTILAATRRTQDLVTSVPGIRGGVPGSFPLHGNYCPCMYPNWAAKFFADALMYKLDGTGSLEIAA
jgi:hypothetical protein